MVRWRQWNGARGVDDTRSRDMDAVLPTDFAYSTNP